MSDFNEQKPCTRIIFSTLQSSMGTRENKFQSSEKLYNHRYNFIVSFISTVLSSVTHDPAFPIIFRHLVLLEIIYCGRYVNQSQRSLQWMWMTSVQNLCPLVSRNCSGFVLTTTHKTETQEQTWAMGWHANYISNIANHFIPVPTSLSSLTWKSGFENMAENLSSPKGLLTSEVWRKITE